MRVAVCPKHRPVCFENPRRDVDCDLLGFAEDTSTWWKAVFWLASRVEEWSMDLLTDALQIFIGLRCVIPY